MKKFGILLYTRFVLMVIILLFLNSAVVHSQCATEVSVTLNGLDSKISVKPGAILKMKFVYSISNPSGWDEDRFNQILVGLNEKYLDCIFKGVPMICPRVTKDSFQKTINAPTTPGTYTIYYSSSREANCNPYSYRAHIVIGYIYVLPDQQCNTTVSLDMNSSGNNITVTAGEAVTMNYNFSSFNPKGCSGCNNQILVGLNEKYLDCIYNGTPPECPETFSGSFPKTINAPSVPGIYSVFYSVAQDSICDPFSYKKSNIIGSITVTQQEQKCNTTVSLKMTSAGATGDKITVSPGSAIKLNFNFSLSNNRDCPTCKKQILVGMNDKFMECIFNNTPEICPSENSDSYQKTITAPTQPGTYTIYYITTQDSTCNEAAYKADNIIGSITVQQQEKEQQCNTIVSLDMNSSGNKIRVLPGAQVNMDYSFSISNPTNCNNCKDQILVGMDSVFLNCIYDNIPPLCPTPNSGNFKKPITAPSAPGVYNIYYSTAQNSNCNSAAYKANNLIGTITVLKEQSCNTTVSLDMNSSGNTITVKPEAPVSMNFKYNISNPPECDNCKNQIMVGLDFFYWDCIYFAVPDICPLSSSGLFQLSKNAPKEPGKYGIFYSTSQKYFCVSSLYKPQEQIGTIIVE